MTIRIEGLSKAFGKADSPTYHQALSEFDLEIGDGEMVVLLGHSGCGKTTALRCLAGLESADSGRISLAGRTVFDAPQGIDVNPESRDIGMVFQSYALWPHMTVRKNIGYPLKARKMKEQLGSGWVEEAAALVDTTALLDRYPAQLSGGQQQRVALARGIVARPELVLMDEPLSNLDALLRTKVRNELHALHGRLRFSGLYVTHDQTEALALGDRVAVMNNGRIEQIGTPSEVFESPQTEHIASFVGMSNVLHLEDGTTMRFRPTDAQVSLERPAESDALVVVRGVVRDVVYTGLESELAVDIAGDEVVAIENGRRFLETTPSGTSVWIAVPRARGAFFGVRESIRIMQ
ncbi:ABC transporter ATP-binding protein [Microbacterium sp. MAHUQ-60]|uniref:ABC transporter ATP-binding protein n=1 Tax=unclassified Microbacterium TaxID=2609290 RepID=UPI0036195702